MEKIVWKELFGKLFGPGKIGGPGQNGRKIFGLLQKKGGIEGFP